VEYIGETGFTHVGGDPPSLSERSHPCSMRCPTTTRRDHERKWGATSEIGPRETSRRGRRCAERGERRERCRAGMREIAEWHGRSHGREVTRVETGRLRLRDSRAASVPCGDRRGRDRIFPTAIERNRVSKLLAVDVRKKMQMEMPCPAGTLYTLSHT
jgi:hypothetical protein